MDIVKSVFGLFVCFSILSACKHVEYVTVPEVHTEYHHTIDSVRQIDSVIDHQTIVVREVDSATMASMGVRLKAAQQAWLIQSDRLQREIDRLQEVKTDTVEIRDSIRVPYPVEVIKCESYVPGVVKVLAWIGGIVLSFLIAWLIWRYINFR